MGKPGYRLTAFIVCCILAVASCCPGMYASGQKHPRQQRAPHYVAEREISFEMNSATGFVRIPAEYVWVKFYRMGEFDTNVVKGRIDISDKSYRFTANINELKKLCGTGARRLPIKCKIVDCRSKKEKSFHITRLLIRFRENGNADVQLEGYIFDK